MGLKKKTCCVAQTIPPHSPAILSVTTRDRGQLPSGCWDKERSEAWFYFSSVGIRSSGAFSNLNLSIAHWTCEGTMSWSLVVC